MRLEKLQEHYGDRISIEWRSFLLRPEPEHGPRPLDKFTAYTTKWETPAGLEPGCTFTFPWTGEHAPPSHSTPSAIAGKVAATFGPEAASRYRMRLFQAYFRDNLTVSRRDVLRRLAGEVDIEPEAFDAAWYANENEFVVEVLSDHGTAVRAEITGVPAVVLDRRYLLPGALDVEQYVAAIEQVLAGTDQPDPEE